MAKKWQVSSSGLYFTEYPRGVILIYPPDDAEIMIAEDEIGDMIEALHRIQSHFDAKALAEADALKLERWGKRPTPVEVF